MTNYRHASPYEYLANYLTRIVDMPDIEMPDPEDLGGNVTKPFKFVTGQSQGCPILEEIYANSGIDLAQLDMMLDFPTRTSMYRPGRSRESSLMGR